MLLVSRLTAVRLAAAVTIGAPLAVGCTSILGIDGNYVGLDGTGGNSGRGGDGGEIGTGGREIIEMGGSGGRGGSGGSGGSGAGGTSSVGGAGGGIIDAGTESGAAGLLCLAGHYTGTFDGTHAPSFVPLLKVPVPVTGTLSFVLVGTGGMRQIADGKIDAKLAIPGMTGSPVTVPFTPTLDGGYDCEKHQMTGHIAGQIDFGSATIDGTLTGDLESPDNAARAWEEHEVQVPTPPTPTNNGKGTWSATWKGP